MYAIYTTKRSQFLIFSPQFYEEVSRHWDSDAPSGFACDSTSQEVLFLAFK